METIIVILLLPLILLSAEIEWIRISRKAKKALKDFEESEIKNFYSDLQITTFTNKNYGST